MSFGRMLKEKKRPINNKTWIYLINNKILKNNSANKQNANLLSMYTNIEQEKMKIF